MNISQKGQYNQPRFGPLRLSSPAPEVTLAASRAFLEISRIRASTSSAPMDTVKGGNYAWVVLFLGIALNL